MAWFARSSLSSGSLVRWGRGVLMVAVVVVIVGVGLTSSSSDRLSVTGTDTAAVAGFASVSAPAVSPIVKAVSAALGSVWSPVPIELVVFVAALTTVVPSSRRTGSCWLRAPPFA
jgi:hypothetical protein